MTRCEACGEGGAETVPGPQRRWRYWRCARCGHAWLHPAPTGEELARYYNAAYAVPRELYVAHVPREHRVLQSLFRRHRIAPGRVLEVGCSYGAMLDAFRRDGWDVEGVELDARAAEVARSFYSLRVHQGRLEDVRASLLGAYDVIALYHVIEHVQDPSELIRDLVAMCRSGGAILIKTPNARSLLARVVGGWWEWYAVPEHLHLFSPSSLRALLESSGLAIEVMLTRRGDAHGTLFELARGLGRRLLRRPAHGETLTGDANAGDAKPLGARRWYQAAHAAIDTAGAPLEWILARFYSRPWLLGPELLVLARKM
jgi:SAM-dependent methyltransferase